jgi:hypothetical protein
MQPGHRSDSHAFNRNTKASASPGALACRLAAGPALFAALAVLALSAGCIARQPVAPDELDRCWYLTENALPKVRVEPLMVGGRALPGKWTFRQEKSLIWSTVSIVRAVDRLRAGQSEPVQMSISPTHARMVADLLADARTALADVRAVTHPDAKPTPDRWADTVAAGLVLVEKIIRAASLEEGHTASGDQEPLGISAEPILRMLLAYLNNQSDGQLLEGLGPGELAQLREVLTQLVLRVGFTAVGKRQPEDLRPQIVEALRDAARPDDARLAVCNVLLARVKAAPPAPAHNRLADSIRTAVHWAPTMLQVLETFVRQWDQMEAITVEFGQLDGKLAVALTLSVKPGAEVRVADLFIMQPAIVLRGSTQVIVQPSVESTRETVVLFEPAGEGGAAEVRFEGLGWGLVRLLALPIADAALREVRVATTAGQLDQHMTAVSLFMEARGDARDPRRLLSFRDVREEHLVRSAFAVERRPVRTDLRFSYVTPAGRYTYQRTQALTEP